MHLNAGESTSETNPVCTLESRLSSVTLVTCSLARQITVMSLECTALGSEQPELFLLRPGSLLP